MNKKKKLLKKIMIICVVIILIELIAMLIMHIKRERNIDHVNDLYNVLKVDDGYIGVGISDFYNSKNVKKKIYEYLDTTTHDKGNVIATQSRLVKFDKDMNILWEKTYDCEYDSTYYDVLAVSDGYIVVGSYVGKYSQIDAKTRDALIVKYDLDGNVVWSNTYSVLSDTEYYKIIDDGDDNYVVIGQSIYENMEMGSHITGGGIIVRYNHDGEMIAHNNYGGNKSGIFNDIIKVSDGYLVCGKDAANYGILVKFKKDFDRDEKDFNLISNKVMWQRTYSNTDTSGFTDMVLVNDKVYCVGAINVSNEKNEKDEPIYQYDAGIVVYNTSGKYLFKKSLGEEEHKCFTSVTTDNEYLYLTLIDNIGGDNKDSMLYKYDLDGNIIKKIDYTGDKNDLFNKITMIDNKYLVIGSSNSSCGIMGCEYEPIIKFYNNELEAIK